MAFIIIDSPDADVWKTNPSLDLIAEFKKLREEEGDEYGGNIIKAIYYTWDPKSSLKDSGIPHDKLLADTTTNLIGDPSFDWDSYEWVKDAYLKYNISKVENLLLEAEANVKGLGDLLKNWAWSKKDVKDRALASKEYNLLVESLIALRDKVDSEASDMLELHSGYTKSLLENLGDG